MSFDAILRARCTRELKARIIRLTQHPANRGRDEADLLRIALEDYCAAEERRLGLRPVAAAAHSSSAPFSLNEAPAPYRSEPSKGTLRRPKKPKHGPSN